MVKSDLEDLRNHIEWKQVDVVSKSEYIEDRVAIWAVLSQMNHIIERFYSSDTEDNKLRQKILEWHEVISTKSEINNRQ